MQIERQNLNNKSTQSSGPSHEEVASFAAQIWDKMGRPLGRDMEIWLQAERQLVASRGDAAQKGSSIKTGVDQRPSAVMHNSVPTHQQQSVRRGAGGG